MICDLCDKDQQSICERSFHFIKPINECLMRKAQENRQIIEELEKIKAEIEEIDNIVQEHGATYINKYGIVKVFNKHISELKGEQE